MLTTAVTTPHCLSTRETQGYLHHMLTTTVTPLPSNPRNARLHYALTFGAFLLSRRRFCGATMTTSSKELSSTLDAPTTAHVGRERADCQSRRCNCTTITDHEVVACLGNEFETTPSHHDHQCDEAARAAGRRLNLKDDLWNKAFQRIMTSLCTNSGHALVPPARL